MTTKTTSYPLRNWPKYNEALKNRGSITFWFSEDEKNGWKSQKKADGKGRPEMYSDTAIQCLLVTREVYHLTLRSLQGFMESIIKVSDLELRCPNYTTISKRSKSLNIQMPKTIKTGESVHVLIDSSGFKIYGEGEWKTRKHGVSKRRTWRKLHIALCAESQSVVGAILTTNNVGDSEVFGNLLDTIDAPIASVSGDGAYDTVDCYDACDCYGAEPIIPPRKRAKKQVNKEGDDDFSLKKRDLALDIIESYGGDSEGRKLWKKESGYHRRSLVETGFFRLKTLFGSQLKSRTFPNQAKEAFARCVALNKMTRLEMPDSYQVIS
jgi:hypothetical protein